MHMARKVLRFNKNTEGGIEEENVQGTSSVMSMSAKPCHMPMLPVVIYITNRIISDWGDPF